MLRTHGQAGFLAYCFDAKPGRFGDPGTHASDARFVFMRQSKVRSRSKHSKRRRRDAAGVLLVGGGVAGLLALGVFVNAGLRGNADLDRTGIAEFEAIMRTGSILFVPFTGNLCRRKMIDNVSGAIWDAGFVDCDIAVAQAVAKQQRQWTAQRVEEIRAGLAKR